MTFLIKNSEKIKEEESYSSKLENCQDLVIDLEKTVNKLENYQSKNLSKLKDILDQLQKNLKTEQKTLGSLQNDEETLDDNDIKNDSSDEDQKRLVMKSDIETDYEHIQCYELAEESVPQK